MSLNDMQADMPDSKTQILTHMYKGINCTEAEFYALADKYSLPSLATKQEVIDSLTEMRPGKYQLCSISMGTAPATTTAGIDYNAGKESTEPNTLSIEETLAQRGSRYGDFSDHAGLAQGLLFRLQTFNKPDTGMIEGFRVPWRHDLNDVQRQAITVIMDKIARILSGDPNYDDNWIDIQGYAKLVQDRLPKESK